MPIRFTGIAGLLLALLLTASCSDGSATGEVAGSVNIDGKSPDTGSIAFIPADGKSPTAGGEIKDGKYTARVPVGTAKVEIRVPKIVGKKKLYNTPDSPVQPIMEEVLPSRYNDKTELTLDVKSGRNAK